MPNWIDRIKGAAGLDVPDEVSPEWDRRLMKALDPLGTLGTDIRNYVIHGEPRSVLHKAAQGQLAAAIGLAGFKSNAAFEIYKEFDDQPVEVRLRWARFLEVAAGSAYPYYLTMPGGAHWPEILLMHSSGDPAGYGSSRRVNELSSWGIEEMLAASGLEAHSLLAASFGGRASSGYLAASRMKLVANLKDLPEALDRHAGVLKPLVGSGDVVQKVHVLELLAPANPPALTVLAGELAELAVSGSKQVRSAAKGLLDRVPGAAIDPLKHWAAEGKPEQRAHALRLLFSFGEEELARETAFGDKAASVRALLEEWESIRAAPAAEAAAGSEVPVIDWSTELTPALNEALDRFAGAFNALISQHNDSARVRGKQYGQAWFKQFPVLSDGDLRSLRHYLTSARPGGTEKLPDPASGQLLGYNLLTPLAACPDLTPAALFKILDYLGLAGMWGFGGLSPVATRGFNLLHETAGRPTLIELGEMLAEAGVDEEALFFSYCNAYSPIAKSWEPEAVWPYFVHHIDMLIEGFKQNPVERYWFDRGALFRAAATLPQMPPRLVDMLFELALGPGKTDRPAAQAALAAVPGFEERVVKALAEGKADLRSNAARWLGRLRYPPAVGVLEQALNTEKNDVAKGVMLEALEQLGQPVDRYLDRAGLPAEAAKVLAKPLPKELAWFPWEALPEVRWGDTLEAVGPDIVRWMIVQAVKQKSPEPNAILRKYCKMFEPRDREQLGQFLLEAWLSEDVKPIPPDEARNRAEQEARMTSSWVNSNPKYYANNPYFGRSVEEMTMMMLPRHLRTPAGSVIGSKGLLAVVAACAGERAAPAVNRYLKDWFGSRAAQGKALIAMLAWIEHPSATQLMLSIGSRFRTKSFQEEAVRQAEALAERNNWTLAELADRTIDTAGFDLTGVLELSYGERVFTAHLLPDLSVELHNPEGKKIASLPEPRASDNEEYAKWAKKVLSTARKQIKETVGQLTDRLYEALCTERDWSFADWDTYLNHHPIARRLVQRLVWAVTEEGKAVQLFRPLEDGSLTDAGDEEVTLAPDARVRLAHDWLMSPGEVEQWKQHLVDYEVKPLFTQLGKGTYALPDGRGDDLQIKDFEGYLLEAFALRGRARALGWVRGPAEDGGVFVTYVKRFPTLGVEAVIEFTGNALPEENRTVALLSLSFQGTRGGETTVLSLSAVPKVLLSECYNDLRSIAADGSGFDPEWQKKAEF